jgi:16S rRNA (guanine527-N7)-methyltransferase
MGDVPRETTEAGAQALASVLFPDRDKEIYRFVDLLTTAGVERGLIGPREGDRLWSRHIVNCAVLGTALPAGQSVADVGSGAGLPGIVLALARPDVEITLVEPLLRRATFLSEAVATLGISNAEVVRARAEELAGHRTFAVVTARAVAPLERLARWTLPLCAPGGVLLAMKGSTAAEELAAAQRALDRMGAGPRQIEVYGTGLVQPETTVIRIESLADPRGKGRS